MKQLLSLWNSFPKKGKNKRSVLSRLAIFVCLLASAQSAWGDMEYTVSLNDGATQTPSGSTYFTIAGSYNANYTGTYGGVSYTKGLKLDSNGKVTFTNTNTATVTIVQSLKTYSSNTIKFNGSNLDNTNRVDDTANNYGVFTISNVAAGTHTIEKGSSETGILYVKVVEETASVSPSANLGAPDYTNGYTWDFTNLDLSNITVGGNWELNGSKYQNAAALTNANLIANNAYIPETKYLTFTATANNLWLSNSVTNKYLAVSQYGSLKIPAVPSGKTVIVKWFTTSASAVSATVTGASESSISTPATAQTTGYSYLTGTGSDITIAPGGWAYFESIEVVDLASKTIPIEGMNVFHYANGNAGINSGQISGRTLGGINFTFSGGDGIKFNEKKYLRLRQSGVLTIAPDVNNSSKNIYKIEIALYENAPATLGFNVSSGTLTRTGDKLITWEGDATGSVTITGTASNKSNAITIQSITIYTDGELSADKQTPGLTLSSSSVTKSTSNSGETVALPLTTTPTYFDADITFSDGGTGSTWNAGARTITVGSTPGTATVTVSYAGNDFYNSVAAQTYTLNIENQQTAYIVTYTANPTGGTVAVSPSGNQVAGTEMTITLTPDANYTVGTVTVTDANSNVVATAGSGNTRTFTMPASNVTISVTFNAQTTAAAPTIIASSNSNGQGVVISNDGNTYTIINPNYKDVKFKLIAQPGTYVTYTYGTNPADPTASTTKVSGTSATIDNISGTTTKEAGDAVAVSKSSSSALYETFYIKAIAFTDKNGSNPSSVTTYTFHSYTAAATVSAPTVTADGNTYTGTNKSVTIATTETGGTTYYKVGATAETSAATIVTNGTAISGSSQTITATQPSTESDIVVSVVTKNSNNEYSEIVTATYTYAGNKTWSLSTPNITIQEGQRGYFHPVITDLQGNDIFEDYNVSDYFDFTYSYNEDLTTNGGDVDVSGVASGMSTTVSGFNGVSADGGIITKREYENDTYKATYVGQKATVTITATRNATALPEGINLDGTTKTGTATATIIEYTKGYAFKLYWDADLTNEITKSDYTEDKTNGNDIDADFGNFPNGRVIYAAPNTATDELWFTYNTTSGTALSRPTKMEYGKHLYQYRRGIPIQVTGTSGTIYVSLQPFYDSGTKDSKDNVIYNSRGSIMNLRFNVVDHERPANLTYEPSTAGTNLSTSISVAAVGTAGNTPKNQVYAKFTGKYTSDDGETGTRTNYTIEGLVNEENVIYGEEQAPVFSTEVNKRIIEGVQYQWYNAVSTKKTNGDAVTYPEGWYVSGINENNYMYRFASKLTLSDNLFNVSIDNTTAANYAEFDEPTVTVSYYNKDKDEDVNITDLTYNRGSEDPVPTEGERITYSVLNHNGAEVSVNESTGAITIGNKSGYATITVSYPGGYTATVNGRPSYTAASSTTYTIYIVNTDEQVPTINPTSRKFVDEQDVTITAPSEWNALYMIQEYNNNDKYNPTFDDVVTYVSSGDNKNCFLLEAGKSVTVTITDSRKVRAFAYNPSATEFNTPGSAGNTSKEISETYTVMEPLNPPTLDPWGDPHYRTTATLKITAIPPAAGVSVYFTTDGSEPTLESEEYDGFKKINISGASTTVKAIAYDPTTGRISAVTTGVYLYTGSVTAPKFQVTGTGAGTYSEGTVTVDKNSIIALVSSDGGNIYYTLDGTTPTSTDAKLYDATFKLVKSVTGKAIVVKDDAISPVTTVTFVLQNEDDIKELWEAVSVTTPKGKMPADDRYVSIANKESKSGNSSTKAVKYMTATFGGMNATGWSNTTIGEKTQGTPLDGVGEYSIRNSSDAADELGNEVINNGSTVHENTFKLPAQGDIVRFEPERDGTLSIWLLQQGGLHYNSDAKFCPGFIRLRPVYMFDERGASLPATSIQSAARLSSNWDDLDVSETEVSTGIYGNWIAKGGSQNGETNKFYTPQQSENIYNMYKNHLTTANISTGEAITPFELTDATVKGYTGIDGHGYVMPSGGFVKYTFSVKGGKSYYFFGYRTKLGIRGFQFTAGTETVAKTATVADNTSDIISDIKSSGNVNADEICNITYQRKFTNGKWAGVVFPFSVSFAQMKKVFGDMVDVIHFESDDEHNINFRRHWYPMIVAGTPVLIKPAKDMGTSVTFEGVRIDPVVDEVATKVTEITGTNYKMTGTFTPSTIKNGDYYISGGNLAYRKSGDINTNACRSWLTPNNDSNAKEGLGIGTTDAFAEEGWDVLGNPQPKVVEDEGQDDTTPIVYVDGVQEDGIFGTDNPTNIYSINGQLVRSNATSTQGLAKGIYIANGKKFIVK